MPTGPLMPHHRPLTLRKPLRDMTVAELEAERVYWRDVIDPSTRFGAVARDLALACDALIARGQPVEPPNGVIAGPVSLSHRVPVIGSDPVVKQDREP